MGKVVERVKVTNFKDTSKSIEIEAVIDTGATMSVLPMDLIQKLGLERIDEFMATSPEDIQLRFAPPNFPSGNFACPQDVRRNSN